MVVCSAYGCNSHSGKQEEGISFHRFPLNNPERTSLWVAKMKTKNLKPTKNHRICCKHFENDLFYKSPTGKIKLLNRAVPTIFTVSPKRIRPKEISKHKQIIKHANPFSRVSLEAVSDEEEEISPREKELKQLLVLEKRKNVKKSAKLITMSQTIGRLRKRIISLKLLAKQLKSRNLFLEKQSVLFENVVPISVTKET